MSRSKSKAPKVPTTLEEWKEAFAEALSLLHQDQGLSNAELHLVLDHIEDNVDRIRETELCIDESDLGG